MRSVLQSQSNLSLILNKVDLVENKLTLLETTSRLVDMIKDEEHKLKGESYRRLQPQVSTWAQIGRVLVYFDVLA